MILVISLFVSKGHIIMRRERRFLNKAQISIVGVGSGGSQIIHQIIEQGGQDVNFVCIDSDVALLSQMEASIIAINPSPSLIDKVELANQVQPFLDGVNLLILTSTLGKKTSSTNIVPLVAQLAQRKGVFTLALITIPATSTGKMQTDIVLTALEALRTFTDAMIVLPLGRFAELYGRSQPNPLQLAQDFICWSIGAICELVLFPGLINIDFADLQAVLKTSKAVFLGGACASGPERTRQAVKRAIESPQLALTIDGARKVLFKISSGTDLNLWELKEATTLLRQRASPDANYTFGTMINPALGDAICMTVLATGFESP
jgi:cell division protein FtsZ